MPINIVHLAEIYSKGQHQERGRWSDPIPIITINREARSILPGKRNHELCVALEGVRKAIIHEGLSELVADSMQMLDEIIHAFSRKIGNKSNNSYGSYVTSTGSDVEWPFYNDRKPWVGDKIELYWPDAQ